MTSHDKTVRSMPLRATDGWSINEGVPERKSAVEKAIAAILSLLTRPRRPPDVPDYLRADVGLPPIERVPSWFTHPINPNLPDPLKFDRW